MLFGMYEESFFRTLHDGLMSGHAVIRMLALSIRTNPIMTMLSQILVRTRTLERCLFGGDFSDKETQHS
jgi:hypothetical protein